MSPAPGEGVRIPAVAITLAVPADHDARHGTDVGWVLTDSALAVEVLGDRLVVPSQLGRVLLKAGQELVDHGDTPAPAEDRDPADYGYPSPYSSAGAPEDTVCRTCSRVATDHTRGRFSIYGVCPTGGA